MLTKCMLNSGLVWQMGGNLARQPSWPLWVCHNCIEGLPTAITALRLCHNSCSSLPGNATLASLANYQIWQIYLFFFFFCLLACLFVCFSFVLLSTCESWWQLRTTFMVTLQLKLTVDESGWKCVKLDESGYTFMKVDESGWKWLKVDENIRDATCISDAIRCSIPHHSWWTIQSQPNPIHLSTVLRPSIYGFFFSQQPPLPSPQVIFPAGKHYRTLD